MKKSILILITCCITQFVFSQSKDSTVTFTVHKKSLQLEVIDIGLRYSIYSKNADRPLHRMFSKKNQIIYEPIFSGGEDSVKKTIESVFTLDEHQEEVEYANITASIQIDTQGNISAFPCVEGASHITQEFRKAFLALSVESPAKQGRKNAYCVCTFIVTFKIIKK